jgi:imidazolonepropionase-like amidohydrolase
MKRSVTLRTIGRSLIVLLTLAPWVRAQEQSFVLKVTTALDGKGQVIHNTIIVVEGGKIARIGGTTPRGAITYDLTGLTVTPAWIDTHDHILWHFHNGRVSSVGAELLPPMKGVAGTDELPTQATLYAVDNAIVTLQAGFTTIQSPGSPEDKYLRDAIARGIIPGPRILTSLEPLTEKSGPPEKLRELVRERK